MLREPILPAALEQARLRQHNLTLIAAAEKDGALTPPEAERLRALIEQSLFATRLGRFIEIRRTLERAFGQGLFNAEEYNTRKAKLFQELTQ